MPLRDLTDVPLVFLLDRIWDVLVQECGAREDGREDFIASVRGHGLTEYRFMGRLGSGGKIRYSHWGGTPKGWLYVDYYPEHRTPERDRDAQRANERLGALVAQTANEVRKAKLSRADTKNPPSTTSAGDTP